MCNSSICYGRGWIIHLSQNQLIQIRIYLILIELHLISFLNIAHGICSFDSQRGYEHFNRFRKAGSEASVPKY